MMRLRVGGFAGVCLANHVSKRCLAYKGRGRSGEIPAIRAMILRMNADFNAALARPGNAQPLRPRKSTALNNFSRNDNPSRRMRAYCNSALSNAMLTLDGHSVVQALHAR